MITQSLGTSLRWEAGWKGQIQQLVIYQEDVVSDTLTFIRGESGTASELPFSYPKISNYTIVGRVTIHGNTTRRPNTMLACQWHHCPYQKEPSAQMPWIH